MREYRIIAAGSGSVRCVFLSVAVNCCIDMQSDGFYERRLSQAEVGTFHPVIIVFIQNLIYVTQ